MEGLTGEINFDDLGRRENYTLDVIEMTVDSDVVKVNIYILIICLCFNWQALLKGKIKPSFSRK